MVNAVVEQEIRQLADSIRALMPEGCESIVWGGCYKNCIAPVVLWTGSSHGTNFEGDSAMFAESFRGLWQLLPEAPFWWDEMDVLNAELEKFGVRHGPYGELYVLRLF